MVLPLNLFICLLSNLYNTLISVTVNNLLENKAMSNQNKVLFL